MSARSQFETDDHPGGIKILFVGLSESSHTHSWVRLLNGSDLNARLFAMPTWPPPESLEIRTYVSDPRHRKNTPCRRSIHMRWPIFSGLARRWRRKENARAWLAQVIRDWRPDIIHTLGLDPASFFYLDARKRYGLEGIGKWIVQARGGPDLALNRFRAEFLPDIQRVLADCDLLIADNELNYQIATDLGLSPDKVAGIGRVPGTGGVDVGSIAAAWTGKPSERDRLILWPKAYEGQQSKGLPVLEAIKQVWNEIRPCTFLFTAVNDELRDACHTLPDEILGSIIFEGRLDRDRLLSEMIRSRVMLAPSLSDGVPNTLYEAMAAGAVPLVSPLPTIIPLVRENENVLFARNLYPDEIAGQLVRAMTDDALVDKMAEANVSLVRSLADRKVIAPKILKLYRELAGRRTASRQAG